MSRLVSARTDLIESVLEVPLVRLLAVMAAIFGLVKLLEMLS